MKQPDFELVFADYSEESNTSSFYYFIPTSQAQEMYKALTGTALEDAVSAVDAAAQDGRFTGIVIRIDADESITTKAAVSLCYENQDGKHTYTATKDVDTNNPALTPFKKIDDICADMDIR